MQVTMTVNGEERQRATSSRGCCSCTSCATTLGLTGTHWGCDTSNCGACVVLDGRRAGEVAAPCSPRWPTGTRSRTVEGLEQDGVLDPVQQGFMEEHGLQCGFCTPGHDADRPRAARPQPAPDRRGDPRGHLRADLPLHRLREHRRVGPLGGRAPGSRRSAERRLRRRRDGRRRGSDPIGFGRHAAQGGPALHPRPGQLRRRHQAARACCTARSCAARSRTRGSSRSTPPRRCSTRRCSAVITGKDLEALNLAWMPTLSADTQAVLATDKVRFQGQEVAFVVAEDRYAARDALELIDVEYEPLPRGHRRPPGARRRRAGHPRRQGGPDRQPHLRLGGRRQGRRPTPCSPRPTSSCRAGHALPARAPGADGDLRRGRRLSTRSPAS